MKNKRVFVVGILVVILVVISSWKSLRQDRHSLHSCVTIIDWIDCIYVDEATYTKNNSDLTVNENEIDKEIGVVKFQLADSIHDVDYKLKNGDATYLEVDTRLFSIKSDEHSIAVLVDGIYNRYTK